MTEIPNSTPAEGGWRSGGLKRALALAPMARPAIRYMPKHPALLIGAAVVGVAGALAWRNRERIAATARPLLRDAAGRGAAMRARLPWAGAGRSTAP